MSLAAFRPVLRRLVEPLSLAGLLTWLAILLGIVRLAPPALMPLIAGLLGGFGLCLIAGMLIDDERAPLRWRRVLVVAQVLLGLATCTIAREGLAPVLLVIAVAQLPSLLTRRGLVAVMIAINLALYLIIDRIWHSSTPVLLTMIHAGFQVFAAAMTIYAERAESARAELAQVNAHLLATHSLLEESARDRERLRLARELHDVAGHTLTALKLQLALLAREPGAAPAVATAAGLADSLLGDIRGVVGQLRQADGLDLRQAITQLAAPIPRPVVHLDLAEDARVDDIAQAQTLLRVAQEALTNAARHSGAANLWLRLTREGRALVLEVRDDGRGARSLTIGHGLAGMRERLAAIGGTLIIASERGFTISARVPLS
jgi:signal transduction histidine kinase